MLLLCAVTDSVPRLGAITNVQVVVKHGMSCPVVIKNRNAMIDSLDLISAPRQGSVGERGRTGLVYRAAQDAGTDSFAFRLHGRTKKDD